MKNKTNLFTKKANERKIKSFPELNTLGISMGASLVIGLFLLGANWDSSLEYLWFGGRVETAGMFKFGGGFIFAALYLAAFALSFLLNQSARKAIVKTGEVPAWVRKLAVLLIPLALTGNIFAAIAGFMTARKKRSIEYNLSSYAILTSLFVIVISALNLFKPALYRRFYLGIALCLISTALYIFAIFFLERLQKKKGSKLLIPFAILLIASAATGNLFALILGMVIIAKKRNSGSNKTIEWVDIIRRIFRNYMAILGLFIIIFLLSLSIMSFFTFDYNIAIKNDYGNLMQPPGLRFPFGTDNLGRCVFTRIIFGARISLSIGIVSTAIPLLFGGLLGASAGFFSNKADNVIMRILDVLYAVPSTLLTIAIVAAFGANTFNLIMALSISNIPVYARTMRAQVMVVSQNEFVEAARACGRKPGLTLIKHIIPNSLAPMIVRASVSIGIAVLSTSSLSYLGLGVEPHIPEWGNILKVGNPYLATNPYLAIYPGVFIIVLVLAFNFVGDGLRDALDPKLK